MPRTISTKFVIDGEAEYKAKVKSLNAEIALHKSELEKVEAQYKNSANSMDALTAKESALEGQIKALNDKHSEQAAMLEKAREAQQEYAQQVNTLTMVLDSLKDSTKDTSEEEKKLAEELAEAEAALQKADAAAVSYQRQLNNTERDQFKLDEALGRTKQYLEEAKNSADGCATSIDKYGKEVKGTGEASGQLAEGLQKLSSAAGTAAAGVAKMGAAAVTAAAAGITAMSTALIKGVADAAAYGDNIDKMSQKMGMSAEAYQEWDAVMQHCGTSIESLQTGMKTLANAVENENDAFKRLGISQEQIASMSNEELFSATISALQNVESETERTYLAGQLLGRGATELGALLNTSAEETEAMRQRVHELGGVMSDEAVKASAAYQDSLQDMQTAFSGVIRGMTGEFLPSITAVMDGITNLFSGDSEKGIGQIAVGIEGFLDTLESTVPQIAEMGTEIVGALANGLAENLPWIADAGMQLVSALGQGIADNLPAIIDTALQIVTMLATSLISALPEIANSAVSIVVKLADGITAQLPSLIPVATDAILQLADTLTDPGNLSTIIDSGFDLIAALADGLVDALPTLIEKAPIIVANLVTAIVENVPKLLEAAAEIIVSLVTGIIDNLPEIVKAGEKIIDSIKEGIGDLLAQAAEWGGQLLTGLWNGITDKVEWLKSKVSDVVDTIKSWFTGEEGFDEHSPSKWAQGVAAYIMDGLAIGMEDSEGKVMQTVDDIVREVKSRFDELANFMNLKSDVGDLEYQLWERTEGKNASETEKFAKQLELLDAKQKDQRSIVEAAAAAYQKVVAQYGLASAESYEYQKALLQEQLALQDLLDEIEEVTYAKQKMAQTEFLKQAELDWLNSGIGQASMAAFDAGYADPFEVAKLANTRLMLPDGREFASVYDALAQEAMVNMATHLPSQLDAPSASGDLERKLEDMTAGLVNAMAGIAQGQGSVREVVRLVTVDGKVLAEAAFDDFVDYGDANGTPIENPRW